MSKRTLPESHFTGNSFSKKLKLEEPQTLEPHIKKANTETKKADININQGTKETEVKEADLKPKAVHPCVANEADDDVIRLSDIIALEYAVTALQQSIKSIVASDINQKRLQQVKDDIDKIKSPQVLLALQRSKLKLAANLKTLYDDKKLGLFDEILDFEENHTAIQEGSNKVNVGYSNFQNATTAKRVEKLSIKDYALPELPEIKDPKIRARVFVHRSLLNYTSVSQKEQMTTHNERYEFIGDSVLNNIMTFVVANQHPYATEGELSQLRSRLISNAALLKWSYAYGFDKKLQYQQDDTIRSGKLKIFADVFEAYIGGLMMDDPNNYGVIYEWLKKLALPVLLNNNDELTKRLNEKKDEHLNLNAKSELYSMIGYARLGLKYVPIKKEIMKDYTNFVVQLEVQSGDVLGKGEGKNIKEAGLRAAMNVLNDKETIEKYSRLRASIPRDVSTKPAMDAGLDKEEFLKQKKEIKEIKAKEKEINKSNNENLPIDIPKCPKTYQRSSNYNERYNNRDNHRDQFAGRGSKSHQNDRF